MNGRIDSLERLARLHQDGVLTDAEFALEKARLLGGDEPRSSELPQSPAAMPEVAANAVNAVGPDDNDLLAPSRCVMAAT
ncbi:SHOCT domain-containing protein [Brevundimonas vesicularis]|uniref:SHOCT domain-containing protein n=1 Tax=Brevundimonas vesicularis TaxID=41276 RepID=UPI003AF5EF89